MIRRTALLVSILQFASISFAQNLSIQLRQQAGNAAAELQVLEAGAKATLEKDTIHVTLPLSAVPSPGARVVVWLASPKDVRSGETVATVNTNGRAASAILPWPKDARGAREEDIGWYRVGYRVDVSGTERSHGVLSVGAITANLMELRLAYLSTNAATPMLFRNLAVSSPSVASKYPPAEPVALRLLAPQRGLFATVRSKSKNKSKSLVLLSSLPQHRQLEGEHTPGILKVLLPPRQSRGISHLD
jgi:hypothetical protein